MDLSSLGILAKSIDIDIPKCQSKQTQVNLQLKLYEFRSPTHDKLKNVHKLENIGYSYMVLFVCLDLVPLHTCVKFDVSMINDIDRRCKHRKIWLRFKI